MTKPNLIFLIYHGRSHFYSTFTLAKKLSARFNIIFVAHEYFKNAVITENFSFYGLKTVPFGLGFEHWVAQLEKQKQPYFKGVEYRQLNTLFERREAELSQMFNTLNPDYILIDEWQSTDFFALYKNLNDSTKVAFLHTCLHNGFSWNYPLLNSDWTPANRSIKSEQIISILKYKANQFWETIKFFSHIDRVIIDRVVEELGLKRKIKIDHLATFAPLIKNLPSFVLSNSRFDFDKTKLPAEVEYLGFMPFLERNEKIPEDFYTLLNKLTKEKESTGSKVAYCSLGTVQYRNTKSIIRFLQNVIKACERLQLQLVISLHPEIAKQLRYKENVYINAYLPQPILLQYCDVFITHGGMNSIKEAIYNHVPMLVVPISNKVDQRGNAARVHYHRLGIRSKLSAQPNELFEHLHHLITNTIYQENLKTLKEYDESFSPDVVTTVERIKPYPDYLL